MDKCCIIIALIVVVLVIWYMRAGMSVQSFCAASGVPSSAAAIGTASAAAAQQAAGAGASGVASLPASITADETIHISGSDAPAVAHVTSTPSSAAVAVNAVAPSTPAAIVSTSKPTVAVAATIKSTGTSEHLAPHPVVVQTKSGAAPAVIVPVGTSKIGGVTTYNYVGCYDDKATHLFPHAAPGYLTVDQCRAAARAAGASHYALQEVAGAPFGTGACMYGSGVDYKTYGSSGKCAVDQYGRAIGGPGINSVYKV